MYMKSHIKSKIHRIKPKKPIFTKLWFWIVILLLIVVSSVLYFLLFYSGIQFKNIIVLGNQKVISKDIENLVSGNINIKIFGIGNWEIDSKSIFLTDTDKLGKEILEKFPLIGDVSINKNLPQTLIINVEERKPIGVFCPQTNSGQTDSSCFSIDGDGVIFESLAPIPAGTTIVRQVLENSQVFSGEEVIAKNIITAISDIQKNLKDNFKINLDEVMITSPLRLDADTNEGWHIYFDLGPNSDINSQLKKLDLLLNGGISSDSRKNLRYINLTPQNKAIVCDNKTCIK